MTNREAFEAWAYKHCYAANEGQWDAWQASRKQAIEDAAKYLEDKRYYGLAEHIKEMK